MTGRDLAGGAGGARDGDFARAIKDLVRYLAEEAGVSEEEALEALERGETILPLRQRERRKRARELFLLVVGIAVLLVTLGAIHVVVTQR